MRALADRRSNQRSLASRIALMSNKCVCGGRGEVHIKSPRRDMNPTKDAIQLRSRKRKHQLLSYETLRKLLKTIYKLGRPRFKSPISTSFNSSPFNNRPTVATKRKPTTHHVFSSHLEKSHSLWKGEKKQMMWHVKSKSATTTTTTTTSQTHSSYLRVCLRVRPLLRLMQM